MMRLETNLLLGQSSLVKTNRCRIQNGVACPVRLDGIGPSRRVPHCEPVVANGDTTGPQSGHTRSVTESLAEDAAVRAAPGGYRATSAPSLRVASSTALTAGSGKRAAVASIGQSMSDSAAITLAERAMLVTSRAIGCSSGSMRRRGPMMPSA